MLGSKNRSKYMTDRWATARPPLFSQISESYSIFISCKTTHNIFFKCKYFFMYIHAILLKWKLPDKKSNFPMLKSQTRQCKFKYLRGLWTDMVEDGNYPC